MEEHDQLTWRTAPGHQGKKADICLYKNHAYALWAPWRDMELAAQPLAAMVTGEETLYFPGGIVECAESYKPK